MMALTLPKSFWRSAFVPVLSGLLVMGAFGAPSKEMPHPDFTKGEGIPEGAKHDWTLGATGARGWIYSYKLETSKARQIAITKVAEKSPSDGKLKVGDVILGIDGKMFDSDPRKAFGVALTAAEAGDGALKLKVWREGKEMDVEVNLPVLGAYSATAPYDCPKSKRIFEAGCKALAERMKEGDYAKEQNPITRSLNAMALLASGDEAYLPLVKKEAKWAADYSAESFQTWYYAYVIMLLSEYQVATGDRSVMPGLKRLVLEAAKGQSGVGSWGHRFAMPDGRLMGYGMMNAPGVPLTISMVLAKHAGVKEPAVDLAIERSAKLLRFYIGKGAIPYGDHHPWTETHEDNGKCGMAGVLFNFLEEKKGAEFFARMCVASHGSERDCGHTGNFTNILWSMPGVALGGPNATGSWMKEFGAWYYDLARGWDGSFRHQGPPEKDGDSYFGWDSTGVYLLAYAMPLKKLLMTGKHPYVSSALDAETVDSLIMDGRGWSNDDRYSAYDSLTPDYLLERLGSWSPTVRERAATALQRRKGERPIAALVKMLDSPDLYSRYGACVALGMQGGHAVSAVEDLMRMLDHEDLWLRVLAADALSQMGEPGRVAVPTLLKRLAQGPSKEDPRGMEQRYLCFAVFGRMLKNSIEGVDPELLGRAVIAGLKNQDGRARGEVAHVYENLSYEELVPLLPAVMQAIYEPSPSGEMFAESVRLKGLELLAKHRIKEGMAVCAKYVFTQNRWASEKRTPEILKILLTYGSNARAVVSELKKTADSFDKGEADFPMHLSKQKAEMVREAIAAIEASKERPELRSIRMR